MPILWPLPRIERRPNTNPAHRSWRALALFVAIGMLGASCTFLERVSLTSAQTQRFAGATVTDISADGRYVVFHSEAPFTDDDTNGVFDVYRRDTRTNETVLVSLRGPAVNGRINDYGTEIVFQSDADLSSGESIVDDNDATDIVLATNFDDSVRNTPLSAKVIPGSCELLVLCDRRTHSGRSTNPDIAGRSNNFVWTTTAVLESFDTNGTTDVVHRYLQNPFNPVVAYVSRGPSGNTGNAASDYPSIGADGKAIAFESYASDLVETDDSNGVEDVYYWSIGNGLRRGSVGLGGQPANGASKRPKVLGDHVAFYSFADNLNPEGDTNNESDVFRVTVGSAEPAIMVSLDDNGGQMGDPKQLMGGSDDGNRVVWNQLGNILVRNIDAAHTTSVTQNSMGSVFGLQAAMSGDGRYVAYSTDAPQVSEDTNGKTDIYLVSHPEPQVQSITPAAPRGTSTAVTISGRGLSDIAAVISLGGITFTDVVVVNDDTVTATATVPAGAAIGATWVGAATSDGGPGGGSSSAGLCPCLVVS